MEICIARQPVFDSQMQVYGYDLLYREDHTPGGNGGTDDLEKVRLLYDSFFVIGLDDLTNGAAAFVDYSKALLESEVPAAFPRGKMVVKVSEDDYGTLATMEDCKAVKSRGYMLALDGFILSETNLSLLEIADLIKIDFTAATLETQAALIRQYQGRVRFFADHIETREEYRRALEIGYDLFEGNFFSKPSIVSSKEIESLDMNLFNLVQELNAEEPDYSILSNIIEHDLGLSYKLLKFVNSAYISSWYKINSIPRAITYLGIRRLHQFVSLMMLKDLNNSENTELIRLSLVRGKLMSLLAQELGIRETGSEYFFTGIFSLIDVILNKKMEEILKDLPLVNPVKQALLGENNELKRMLDFIVSYEKAQWDQIEGQYPLNLIGNSRLVALYLEALKWANLLD